MKIINNKNIVSMLDDFSEGFNYRKIEDFVNGYPYLYRELNDSEYSDFFNLTKDKIVSKYLPMMCTFSGEIYDDFHICFDDNGAGTGSVVFNCNYFHMNTVILVFGSEIDRYNSLGVEVEGEEIGVVTMDSGRNIRTYTGDIESAPYIVNSLLMGLACMLNRNNYNDFINNIDFSENVVDILNHVFKTFTQNFHSVCNNTFISKQGLEFHPKTEGTWLL